MICHTFLLVLSVLEGCCRVAENYFSILKIFLFPISPHQRFKLSYLSKREASTTDWEQGWLPSSEVVIPLQTKSFYNRPNCKPMAQSIVVIPLQTKGFYNLSTVVENKNFLVLSYLSKRKASTTSWTGAVFVLSVSCHTPPNERLLQHWGKEPLLRFSKLIELSYLFK